ncbi:MAG: epoxyqueuosine reductase QueH, partial [Desulfobacteraceae bacterium]
MKKVLMHICCAPCAIYPLAVLKDQGMEVMGFFYRHNIHPFTECMKREDTLKTYADKINLKVIYQKDYQLEEFIQSVVFRESDRCRICYFNRLDAAAKIAKKGKFDYFTTT